MFDNLGWPEIIALVLIGLFVFGPERLPKVIGDAAKMLRTVRDMARNATSELRDELGTDIDLQDLHPKTFVRKHLLTEDEEESLRRPLRDAMREFEDMTHADEVAEARAGGDQPSLKPSPNGHPMDAAADRAARRSRPVRFDTDAT